MYTCYIRRGLGEPESVTELDHSDHRVSDLVGGFAAATPERDVFTIRDLTKEFAVSARTLRFYQRKVALAKFDERIERLERQKSDIDRVVAELTRASDLMKTKLAARGATPGKVGTGFPSGVASKE